MRNQKTSGLFNSIRGAPTMASIHATTNVAVPYCWPKDKDGKHVNYKTSYTVRSTDENRRELPSRTNRAPDEVIGRAVEFAIL
jgi:hypothetical protein